VSASRQFTVRCPDCGCQLTVDAETGAVLSHQSPAAAPAGGHTFDSLLADLDARKAKAEELFEQEKAAFADRERLLEEKFRQALRRAEEEPDLPPKRPFDLD